MKTKLLVSVLAFSTSYGVLASDSAKNYNGWTLGVDGGWVGSSLTVTDKNEIIAAVNNGNTSKDLKHFNQASFGVHTDWHKTLTNHVYWGFGIGAGFHVGNPSKNIITAVNNRRTYNFNAKQQRNFYAETVGRLGWNFNKAILYALGAVKTTHMEHKIEMTASGGGIAGRNINYSEKKFINSVGFGGGFDFKINKDWSFGAEYRYMFEESVDVVDPNNTSLINVSLSKLRSHNVLGRVSYHF